jgi:hypothetical protein
LKLFESNTYQDVIEGHITFQKSLGHKVTYQKLAEIMRIQKSYLSKVMAKGASLSKDQLYLFSQHINLSSSEMDYLFLLLDIERCGIEELKNKLVNKAQLISLSNTQSDAYLNKDKAELDTAKMNEYYLNAENQLVHLALSISRYQQDIEGLKKDLKLSSSQFTKIIILLERLDLIQVNEDDVTLKKSNLHLAPDSPYFESWKNQFTLKAFEWNKTLEEKDKYNFTVSFTANDETKEKIRLEFLKILKSVEKDVSNAPSKNLYQMSFDLFKWL